jgi:ribonuclease BN (tRNA processing enzyme)
LFELHFLGTGSAFNSERGNNSAFFLAPNNEMFLIDCGASVLESLRKNYTEVLKTVSCINIFITHLHFDHVGSLQGLVLYCKHISEKKVRFFVSEYMRTNIEKLIESWFPDDNQKYKEYLELIIFNDNIKIPLSDGSFIEVQATKEKHAAYMKAVGYIFKWFRNGISEDSFYYTGDTRIINAAAVDALKKREISRFYADVGYSPTKEKNQTHVTLEQWAEAIPNDLYKYIYCMHINPNVNEQEILSYGFNIAG